MLDVVAPGDQDVADQLRREQPVVDDAGRRLEAARPAPPGRRPARGSRRSRRRPGCGDVAQRRGLDAAQRRAQPERQQLQRDRRVRGGRPPCRGSAITMKRSAAAATIFSRVCAPPPPLTSQPAGSTWSAPSIAMSSRSSFSKASTSRPSSRAAPRWRATWPRSGRRSAPARPAPAAGTPRSSRCRARPAAPLSTSCAAARAAASFSRSTSVSARSAPCRARAARAARCAAAATDRPATRDGLGHAAGDAWRRRRPSKSTITCSSSTLDDVPSQARAPGPRP